RDGVPPPPRRISNIRLTNDGFCRFGLGPPGLSQPATGSPGRTLRLSPCIPGSLVPFLGPTVGVWVRLRVIAGGDQEVLHDGVLQSARVRLVRPLVALVIALAEVVEGEGLTRIAVQECEPDLRLGQGVLSPKLLNAGEQEDVTLGKLLPHSFYQVRFHHVIVLVELVPAALGNPVYLAQNLAEFDHQVLWNTVGLHGADCRLRRLDHPDHSFPNTRRMALAAS